MAEPPPASPELPRRGAVAQFSPRADPGRANASDLDITDLRILDILRSDGRVSNRTLAKALGISTTASHYRLRRLWDQGYIVGVAARLNPALFDSAMLVFAEVCLSEMTPAARHAFKAAAIRRPEVLECHETSGTFDYLIKVRVPDMASYRSLMSEVIWKLPGVRETRTYVALEEVKNTEAFSLQHATTSCLARMPAANTGSAMPETA